MRVPVKSKKNKPRIRKDHKGEYYYERYFIRGKMKLRKIYVIDGIPVDEFYRKNAAPITLMQDGEYELLNEIVF
jgi:hypothetical protein